MKHRRLIGIAVITALSLLASFQSAQAADVKINPWELTKASSAI